jgi:RHS repeat-associated protein
MSTLAVISTGDLQFMNIFGNGLAGRVEANNGAISTSGAKRYYIADLLGSVRAVVDETGDVKENRDYDPWGVPMDQRQYLQGSKANEQFSGKELDDETGWYHFGARDLMAVYGRWPSPDPLADKYPSVSPYVYAMNNPLIFIDPDGREVQICVGEEDDQNCVTYEAGMSSKDFDESFETVINTLNDIYSTEIGADVLSELIKTENIYEIMIHDFVQSPSFRNNTINLDDWLAGSAEITSHELFHAYQQEMGSLGSSHFKESEALLFGAGVVNNLGERHNRFGKTAGNTFDLTMEKLLRNSSFDQSLFDLAVDRFKGESLTNSTGVYNNRPLRDPRNKQLIHKFFPLKRK